MLLHLWLSSCCKAIGDPSGCRLANPDGSAGVLVVSATQALYENSNSSGKMIGVFIADCYLDQISSYFREEMQIGNKGEMYVYEKNGWLVGASDGNVSVIGSDGII